MIQILEATTIWCYDGNSDKIYSVQLLKDGAFYKVEAQWGKRGVTPSAKNEQNKYSGASESYSRIVYINLLHDKKLKGYDRAIDPAIIPEKYSGKTLAEISSKEEQMRKSREVSSLHDFLRGAENVNSTVESEAESEKELMGEGFSALLNSMK